MTGKNRRVKIVCPLLARSGHSAIGNARGCQPWPKTWCPGWAAERPAPSCSFCRRHPAGTSDLRSVAASGPSRAGRPRSERQDAVPRNRATGESRAYGTRNLWWAGEQSPTGGRVERRPPGATARATRSERRPVSRGGGCLSRSVRLATPVARVWGHCVAPPLSLPEPGTTAPATPAGAVVARAKGRGIRRIRRGPRRCLHPPRSGRGSEPPPRAAGESGGWRDRRRRAATLLKACPTNEGPHRAPQRLCAQAPRLHERATPAGMTESSRA